VDAGATYEYVICFFASFWEGFFNFINQMGYLCHVQKRTLGNVLVYSPNKSYVFRINITKHGKGTCFRFQE